MSDAVIQLPVDAVQPSPFQPREQFDEAALAELAESVRRHGVVQPLVVRRVGETYELVAGERRLRAARRAGLETVPVIVRPCTDREALELALVENLQRQDIRPLEAARAFQRLAVEFGYTQTQIAERTGRSRAAVANTLRLLQLAPAIQRCVDEGEISEGHARALLTVSEPEVQQELCDYAIRNALSVRELEQKARACRTRRSEPTPVSGNPLLLDLEERLRRRFGTKAQVRYRRGRGALLLEYYSDEDLERLLELLGVVELRPA